MNERIKYYFRRSWLSCEQFALRSSRKLDSNLAWREELGYRFHYSICNTCRHVERHWRKLQNQIVELPGEIESLETAKLSESKASEIKAEIAARLKS